MSNEVELKLLIAPDDIERLFRQPVFDTVAHREVPPQQLLSVYYDTPTLELKKRRIALRLRHIGNQWIQTVKTEGKVAAGLHERPEWECETTENTLDFDAIPDSDIRVIFSDPLLRAALAPVFVTEFSRTRSFLEFPDGDIVELSIDRGKIRAGERQLPICEIECELKAGNPVRLFTFALALQETIPLKLENVSKAERGYQLVTAFEPVPVKATTPELSEHLSAGDAFAHILQAGLGHLQANEDGALHSDDPEFIHQVRVALRRLRSALNVFSPLVPREDREPIQAELRWLTKELDAARNWDVFTTQTLVTIRDSFSETRELEQLQTKSEAIRQQYRLRAREALASGRYQRMLLHLGSWLCMQPWNARLPDQVETAADKPVTAFATRVLQKLHTRLKKSGKQLAILSPDERHRTRITAKKLRYASEFFSSLYPHKRVRRYLAALADLQEVLGILNDATTTERLLQQLEFSQENSNLHAAKNLVLGWTRGTSQARTATLNHTWKHVGKQKVFW
jgi:inorganic triphosphatase YgiF